MLPFDTFCSKPRLENNVISLAITAKSDPGFLVVGPPTSRLLWTENFFFCNFSASSMQQLQIQERTACFALLEKAEVLCNTWRRLLSKSSSQLLSLTNLVAQRIATLDLSNSLSQHKVDSSRLIYKQTESISSTINSLHTVLDMFAKVKNDWHGLEAEATRLVSRALPPSTKPAPLSTNSMIQVTAIAPTQVHDMISRLGYMYAEEYVYKATLLQTLPLHMVTQDQIQDLTDRWSAETRIDDSVEDELCERLKLYKVVKRVLESVD
jgi:hypothetical protein